MTITPVICFNKVGIAETVSTHSFVTKEYSLNEFKKTLQTAISTSHNKREIRKFAEAFSLDKMNEHYFGGLYYLKYIKFMDSNKYNEPFKFQSFSTFDKGGRVETIDLLKLFAAILVVFSHCIAKYVEGGTSTPIFNFIWLIQMPLFMFTTGYVNADSNKVSTMKKYLFRLARNSLFLLLPCLSFMIITSALDGSNITTSLLSFYKNPETNLWFLWVLFMIHFIFDFGLFISTKIRKKVRTFVPVAISLLVSLGIVLLMFSLKNSFNFSTLSLKLLAYYIPFYCFGYFFHYIVSKGMFRYKKGTLLSIVFLVFSLTVVTFEIFFFDSIYSFDDGNIKLVLIRVLGSVCAVYVCVFGADLLCKFKIFRIIAKGGMFSLEAYYLHIIFLRFLNYSNENNALQWLISIGSSVLLLFLVALLLVIIYFIPFLHLVLFGKSFSFYKFEKRLPKIFR